MKKQFSKIFAVALSVAALAVSVPVSAFAKSSKPLSYLYTYRLNFDGYDTMSISPDDTGYLTVPALPDGYAYWMCNGRHFTPGQQLTYDSLDDWMCPGVDLDDDLGHGRYISSYFMPMTGETVFVHYYTDTTAVKIDAVSVGGSTEVPATADGKKVVEWANADKTIRIAVPNTVSYDDMFWHCNVDESDYNLNLYAIFEDDATYTDPTQPAAPAAAPPLLPRTTPRLWIPAPSSRRRSMRPLPTAPGASSTPPARSAVITTGPARATSMFATPAATRPPQSSAPRV